MSDKLSRYSIPAVVFVVVAAHISLLPKVVDLDGFYHMGHAAVYAAGSIFDTALPWATQSIIGSRGADMWWGFHLLLMPFSLFPDVADGVRVAAFVLTLTFALGLSWILTRHGVSHGGLWAALFLVAVPNVLYQYLSVRPHVLTMLLALLLLSVLTRGRWWWAALLATAMTFLHLGFFWMAPGIVCAYGLVRVALRLGGESDVPDQRVPLIPALSGVFFGTALGALLRPHPIQAAALANVQIVRLFLEKATDQPVIHADELLPLAPLSLASTSWAFLALWLFAGAFVVARLARGSLKETPPEERTLLLTSLTISLTFLALTLLAARRAQIQWVTFGFLVLPLTWSYLGRVELRRGLRAALALLLVVHLGWAGHRHMLNVDLVAFPGNTLEEAADFLAANSEPGEIVFHARWDNFGPLFARDRTNLYISGMDPIFQLAKDPRLYWEYFYLSADINVEWSCDAFPCSQGVATDTHTVIQDHFGARWVLVEPRRNPRLTLYLMKNQGFRLALETQREAVFEVLPDPPTAPGV
jgi:hypothetical protein